MRCWLGEMDSLEFPRTLSLREAEGLLEFLASNLSLNVYYLITNPQKKSFLHSEGILSKNSKDSQIFQGGRVRYLDDLDTVYNFQLPDLSGNNSFKKLVFISFIPSEKVQQLKTKVEKFFSENFHPKV